MKRMVCVAVATFVVALSVFAGEPGSLTRHQIKQDLFSHRTAEEPSLNFPMQGEQVAKKSVGLAVLYSLLVPGLGEYYADNYGSGKYFSVAEGALWLTYATFDVYGTTLRDDARAFATAHAGVIPAGKSDQFYVDVSNFQTVQEFNEKRLRERSPERLYDPNAGFGWQWDTDANRALFKENRLSADNVLNNRKFVVAAIVINHVVSAINAARGAISYNKEAADQMGELQLKADVLGGIENPRGVMLTISKNF